MYYFRRQRFLCALLLCALLLSSFASAAPEASLELSFTEIETAMHQGSPVLKSNAANREVYQYLRNKLDEAAKMTGYSLTSISELNTAMSQLRAGLSNIPFDPLHPPSASEMALRYVVDALISIIAGQINSQLQQLTQTTREYAQGGEMAMAINQLYDADLQTIYGACRLYQSYWQIQRRILMAEVELDLTTLQLETASRQFTLGLTTELALKELEARQAASRLNIALITLEQNACLAELNLQLGRSADDGLLLKPMPEPDREMIATINLETTWQQVYKESYLLKGKKQFQGSLVQQYDETVRLYGELGDRAWRSEQELEAAKMSTALTEEQLHIRLNKAYEQLELLQVRIDLEEATAAILELALLQAEQKYNLGYISALELEHCKYQYLVQTLQVTEAKEALSLACYQWMLVQKGMSIS